MAGRSAPAAVDWRKLRQLLHERFGIAYLRPGLTLVVSPLIALMQDQAENLAAIGVATVALHSGLDAEGQAAAQAAIAGPHLRVLLTTPERLSGDRELVATLKRRGVSLLVIDEAHCLSQWGHDFRPAFLELGPVRRALGSPPVLALTAAATPQVVDDVARGLELGRFAVVNTGTYRPNLRYRVEAFEQERQRLERLGALVAATPGTGIIYTATVNAAQTLHAALAEAGESVALYHARLPSGQRNEDQERFMSGEVRVMVATNAFGLGIDKPDTRFVIHYQMPASLEAYYQESGRAGRDGEPADCTLLYLARDRAIQRLLMAGRYPGVAEVQAVYDALLRPPETGHPRQASELAKALPIAATKVKVVLALLREHRIAAVDRQQCVRLLRPGLSHAELAAMVTIYTERAEREREMLERMVFYARCGYCRWQVLLEQFDAAADFDRCGVCDNCESFMAASAEAEGTAIAYGGGDH